MSETKPMTTESDRKAAEIPQDLVEASRDDVHNLAQDFQNNLGDQNTYNAAVDLITKTQELFYSKAIFHERQRVQKGSAAEWRTYTVVDTIYGWFEKSFVPRITRLDSEDRLTLSDGSGVEKFQVIELSALQASQAEVAELKAENEKYKSAYIEHCKMVGDLKSKLKTAVEAIDKAKEELAAHCGDQCLDLGMPKTKVEKAVFPILEALVELDSAITEIDKG